MIIGSETTNQSIDWQIDSYNYMFNGICISILALLLYYSVNICFRDFEYLTRILINRNEFLPWQY